MTEEALAPEAEALPADSLLNDAPSPLDFTSGKPEGFSDEYWDAEKNAANVDKLYKDFQNRDKIAKDLRVKLSKGEYEGKPPENIADYLVEIPDALKESVPNDDPLLQSAREAAKAAGLPKEVFNKFMGPMIAKVAELQAQALDGFKEQTPEEISAARQVEIDKLGPTGNKIVGAVGSFIQQLEAGGTFSPSEAAAVKAALNNAEVVRAFNKLRTMSGGHDQVPIEMPIDERASLMDVQDKMAKAMLSGNEAEYLKYSSLLAKQSR